MPTSPEVLQRWSQVLLWISIVLPTIGASAAVARYYVERYEKRLSSARATATVNALQVDVKAATQEAQRIRGDLDRTVAANSVLEQALSQSQAQIDRLAAATAPRTLSSKQREALQRTLSRTVGTVHFSVNDGDTEALSLAKTLQAVFQAAGWQTGPIGVNVIVPPPPGLVLKTASDYPHLDRIVKALSNAGVPPEVRSVAAPPDAIFVFVGRKPDRSA